MKVRKCVDERISMKWIGVSCNKLFCVFQIFSRKFLSSFLRYLLLSWLSNTTIGSKSFWSCILIFTPLWFHKNQDIYATSHNTVFLEYWNIKKSLTSIQQHLSCLLDWVDCKNMQKIFLSRWLFEIIHIICFEMHIDRPDKSE